MKHWNLTFASFSLLIGLGALGCESGTSGVETVAEPQETVAEADDGDASVEESWQVKVEYPLPSEAMKELWSQPYTYPYQVCTELEDGHPFEAEAITPGENGEDTLCVWQHAQGCVPGEKVYTEFGSCEAAATTSAAFYKFPGYKYESDASLLNQEEYQAEAKWAKDQVRACGCMCCHDSKMGLEEGFATAFDVAAEGVWTDTMTDFGLATAAGLVDTTLLGGSFLAEENHGFDRFLSIFPTDDEERMAAFFLSELKRRGLDDADIQEVVDSAPLRFAGLWTNFYRETEPCEAGIGIDPEGVIHWTAEADARFIYVLVEGSDNVGEPPGLDMPEGIVWRMDTSREYEPHPTGSITYGVSPEGAFTRVPSDGEAPALVEGTTYKLVVLKDFGPSHLTNCSFVFGEPIASIE